MGLFGGSGKKSIRSGRKQAYSRLAEGERFTEEAFGLALPELLKALQGLGEGYDLGLGEVERVGGAAYQRTQDREQGLIGRSRQNLQSRGLSSTTVGTNLERGIAYDTNLALGQIDDQLAQLRSGLRVGKGTAMAQGLGSLANAYLGRGQQQFGEQEAYANVALGTATNLAAADQFETGMNVSFINAQSQAAAEAMPDSCCWIMLEGRYGDGTMDDVVRRFRDEAMTDRNRRGYYKVAQVLVPLMRKSRVVKWLVQATMCDPLVSYGKWRYGQNKHGWLLSPFKVAWTALFDAVGGDEPFLRENGEYI